ncbi:uncharacterized protein LOC130949570 [Arachis stenosperma]|uniref:uncharacterized protein LOC130949570 n=1 Tax=Arachis stenosperma TaxID=217475 RepID=UPI0025ACAF1E|nr:uncharacterized protein LOC130949570 [Arachis stenosperma]
MTHSLPDPNLPIFDPEIKRIISRIRRAKRRLVLSEDESEPSVEEETSPRSTDSVVLRAEDMAARRATIQEEGAPDFTMQPFQAHHPSVATDFEIKTTLLNLMPKFHGLPAQEPIKHLRDFQAACSIVRRDGTDETSILLKSKRVLQQEDNMVASTHNFYDRPNQGYNQGGNNNRGWQDNSNQNWRDNNNRGGRDNQENQRWNNNNNRQQNQPYRAPHLRQNQRPQNNQQ